MKTFFLALGVYKDGITTLLAIFFVVVGFYQCLEFRSDKRIETSLEILERRESTIFVEARTKLLSTWFEADGTLAAAFRRTDTYTDALYAEIDTKIHGDPDYRTALLHISAYYSNAAACVLDGLCDQPTICSSLHGEIQDYLDINRNYFVYLRTLREEDSVALYLHHPEFVDDCDDTLMLSLFARTDGSLLCRFARGIHRTTGWAMPSLCEGKAAPYTQDIIERAKLISTRSE